MKLSSLRESITSTAVVADRPMALPAGPARKRTRRRGQQDGTFPISDDYMGTGVTKEKHKSRTGKTEVWQPFKSGQSKKRWWDNFAQLPNQDERLLPQFRGKGY